MDVNPTQEFLNSRQLAELQKVVDGLKKVLEVVKFSKDKELGTNHRDEIERYLDFIEKHLKTDPLRWFCVDVSYKNHLQDLTDEQFEVLHLESLSLTEFFVKGFLTLLAQVNIVESDAVSANSWLAQAVVQCLVALVSFWAGKELETAKSLQENLARLAYDIAKFVSGGDPGSVICITSSNGKHLVELRCFSKASTELFAASNTLLSNPYEVGKVLKIPSILLQLTDNGDYDILQNLFLGLTKVLSKLQSSKVCGPFRQKHDLGDILIYAALCDNLNMLSQSFHLYNETPSLDTLELREENQFLVCVFAATKIALNQETNLAYMVALKQSWKRLTTKVTKMTDPSHGVVIVNDILNRLTSELEACVLPKFLIHGSLDEVCYQLLEYFMDATSVDNDDIPLYLSHLRRLFTIISTKAIHLDVSKTHWLTLSSVGMLEDVLFYERMNVGSQESSFADIGSQETDASVNTEEMRTQSTISSEPDFQYHFNHELLFDRQIQEFISLYHSIEDSENIDPEDLCRIANICSTVFQFRFLIQERKPAFSTVNTKSVMKNFATFLNELDLFVDGLCCQLSNHQVGHAAIENTMNFLKIYAKYRFSGSMKDTSSTCLRGNSYFKQVLEFPVSNRTGDVNAPFINNTTEFEAYVELCGYLKLEDWASLKDKILQHLLRNEDRWTPRIIENLLHYLANCYDIQIYSQVLQKIATENDLTKYSSIVDKIICGRDLIYQELKLKFVHGSTLLPTEKWCVECTKCQTFLQDDAPIQVQNVPLVDHILSRSMSEIENSMHKVIQSYLVHIGANEMVFTGLVNLYIRRTCDLKERQATLDTFAVYMKKSLKMNNSVALDIALHWIQSTPFELTVENEQKVFMLLDLFVRLEGQLLIDLTVALLKRFWKDEQGFRWLQQCFLKFKNNQTAKRLENLYEKNTELLLDKLIEAVLDDDASQRKFDKGQNYLDSVFICLGKELAFNPMTNLVTKLVRLYPLDNYQQLVKSVSKDAFAYCGQLYGSKKSSEVFNLELLTSIYPKLYVSIMNGCCSFDEFRTAAKNLLYMVDLTRSEGTIFSRSRHHIVYELLSCIEGKQDFAPRILSVVRQFDVKESKNKSGFASSSEPISTLEDVLNYAQRRGSVQGYIVNLTGKIKKASDIEKYEKQVRSLAFILLHLENRTDQLDRTISAFLNKLIEKNDNCDIVFDLYDAFVKKISTSTLQERLCEVSKDMISLIYSRPHRVAGILEELVSKALALNLEKKIATLSFLPCLKREEFTAVREQIEHCKISLQASQASLTKIQKLLSFREELEQQSENDMKFVSLLKIAKFCEADMTGLLHKPDIKYEVCKLVESLMYESLNAEDDVKIAVAEALGAIGALDPFWFDEVPLSQGMPSDEKTKRLEVNHQRFPGVLIEKLCDLLNRRTEVNYMLTVQFVLQELLKTFKFSPKQLETIGLSNYAQMICEPLFSSEYSHPKDEWEVTAPPIFNLNKSFECWINEWTRTLIKLMPNELPKRVFESLSHMFSFDASFTQWVLQFVVKEFLLNEGIEHTDKELYFLQEINQIVKTSLPFASQGHLTGPKSSLVEFKVSFTSVSLQSIQHRCAQTIFSLYDLFAKKGDKYFRIVLKYISEVEDNENWCLSKSDLATLAFASQAYHRALKLLEEHLSSEQRRLGSCYRDIQDDQYVLMQKIYIALDETDGVFGLIAKRKKPPSLSDEIIEYEAAGDLQEALSCAENGLSRDHDDLDSAKTFLRCALSLGQERTALIRAQHMVTSKPKWKSNMLPLQVEAAWKLGSWSELETYVNEFRDVETANTTSIAIGQLLHCIKSRDEAKFARVMKDVRRKEMGPISAAVMEAGSYVRSYQHLVRLHILTDIEKAAILHFSKLDSSELAKHYKTWENRKKSIDYIQQNTRYVENVSSFHRVFMNLNNPELHTVEILKSWLNSAKVSRKSGNLHLAHKCLMEIDGMCRLDDLKSDNVAHGMDLIADVVIEKAKHLWSKDDPSSMEKALKCLKNGANEHFRELTLSHRNSPKSDPNYSRLVLLHTIYADQMHNTSSGEIIEGYKESIRHNDRNEEAFFRLAKLYEKMASANLNDENSPAHLQNACKNFFRSLKCGGYKHTYEALPRLLTCWFDLGMRFKPRETKFFQEIHESVMLNIRKTVPGYILYSSLSQMLSRLCHRNQAVRKTLCDIIRSIAQDNPHQIAWKLIHVYFSTDEERQNACEKIMDSLNTYGSDKATIKQIWLSYKDFGAALIKFKDYKFHLDQNHRATLDDDMDMAKYFTAVKKGKQCRILLPMTETLKERVPFKTEARGFGKTVYISEMNPVVVVMQSKVKPIKITFKGDDGREHSLLYKPSDDLRMDARAMEFIDVVNRHLMRDREARKRQLFVRRYAVIPITKVCGLVEWIDNLQSLRAIFYDAYSRFGSLDKKAMSSLQLNMREWEDKRTEERRKQGKKPKKTGLEVTEDERMTATQWTKRFKVVVLEKVTPPCFGQWFLQEYRDPITWFTARLSFVRSCAVMSMIGYILGLGDRHLENILLDTRTGQVIHVDLSMLFNAGETLPVPEAVPFRLTQNMIDAMGPTGHDGVFRKACEATMRVMSENKDALVSVLQTLAYDPGVEAIGGRSAQNRPISISSGEKEIKNEMVLKHCKKVEDRLDGIVDTDTIESRIPVSISGHVKILIDQATNIERLSKMYFGWTPFL